LVDFAQDFSNFTLAQSTGAVSTVSQFTQSLARSENYKVKFIFQYSSQIRFSIVKFAFNFSIAVEFP